MLPLFITKVEDKQSATCSSDVNSNSGVDTCINSVIKAESEMPKLTIPPSPQTLQQMKMKDNSLITYHNQTDMITMAVYSFMLVNTSASLASAGCVQLFLHTSASNLL